jgi:hypothetical protein
VVLVTATPHAGDTASFESLCAVGRLSPEDDLVVFQRSRRNVGIETRRHVRLLPIRPTLDERHLHLLLERYTRRVWRESAADDRRDARLAMIVLRKRALSSARSLARSIRHRLDLLEAAPGDGVFQLTLPLDDPAGELDERDAAPAAALAAPGLSDRVCERTLLNDILQTAARASLAESKVHALRRLLRRTREPAIVFTEYRDTLLFLHGELHAAGPVAVLHGGLGRAARRRAETDFTSGRARLLLATDAAGEGLNLHARCRLVVNFELPWNPMRLEQRIGRVDRIGQARTTHAIHLMASGTAEEDVLAHLVHRLGRARASMAHVGDPLGELDEADIAEYVFSDPDGNAVLPRRHQSETTARALPFEGLREAAVAEVVRLTELRRLWGAPHGGHSTARGSLRRLDPYARRLPVAGAVVSLMRWRRVRHTKLKPGVIAIWHGRVHSADGRLLETVPCAVHVMVDIPPLGRRRANVKRLIEHLLEPVAYATDGIVRRSMAERLVMIQGAQAPRILRLRDREAALAGHDEKLSPTLVQPGLFDRRQLHRAAEERAAQCERSAESERRIANLTSALDLSLSAPELALVLIITP